MAGCVRLAMSDRKRKLDVYVDEEPATTTNPYTGRPYSRKYYEILQKRKGGPSSCSFLSIS